MASVWGELKRRKVVKVAVAYAIVGWILVEVSATVLPIFEAPDWIVQVFTFFVILGFPLALILSWAYELTPEGIKLERNVATGESITHVTGRKLDFAIIGTLIFALGFVVVDNYVLEDGDQEAVVQEPTPIVEPAAESPAPIVVEEQREVLPNSVAVLPFENLSPDPDNAYFAAGIHEAILNALAKIRAMNVIARTSMLRYADRTTPIEEIARELNVETVMEGSVQYAEGRVLVTAQLIDPGTNAHLWSDSYNRDFSDIFAIQADIAMNIANALETEFSLAEQERIEQIPTVSPAAYMLYLRAAHGRGTLGFDDLDQAIALDPEFALAYASKAYWYAEQLEGASVDPAEAAALMPVVRENAERALALDPTIGIAHSALANLHNVVGDLAEAQAAYERALELSPNDPNVLALYARFKRYTGEYSDAISLSERSVELGPYDRFPNLQLSFNYWYAHDYEAAVTAFQRCIEMDATLESAHLGVAFAEVSQGNYDEALRELQIAEQLYREDLSSVRLGQFAFAYGQMGLFEDSASYFSMLEELSREGPVAGAVWAMAYFAIADYDEAYRRLENAVSSPQAGEQIALSELKANAYGDSVLQEPRWQELRDRIGVL